VAEFVRAGWRRRQLQRATLAATIVAVIAVLAGFLAYALVQADRAREERGRALDLARVSVAGEWLDKDPTKAALVLLEVDPANTRFAPRKLSAALNRGFVGAEYRHAGPVHSVAISPDASRVLTTSGKQAMVWEARGRVLRTLQRERGWITSDWPVRGSQIGEVGEPYFRIISNGMGMGWRRSGSSPETRTCHDACFSPDRRLLVTVTSNTRGWTVETGQPGFSLGRDGARTARFGRNRGGDCRE
jgi:WD40 repeat protein